MISGVGWCTKDGLINHLDTSLRTFHCDLMIRPLECCASTWLAHEFTMEIGIQKVSEFLQSENFLSVRISGPPIGAGPLIFCYHLSVGH